MGTVDLLMIADLGRDATAAVGIGNTWSFSSVILGLGAAAGIDPMVAQAYGARRPRDAGAAAAYGMVLVLVMSVPVIALHLLAAPALRWLGQPAAVIPDAATYSQILAVSVVPVFAFAVVRQWLQGSGRMRPAMWVVLLGNVVNAVANALLISRYGVAGVAWSTVVVRWFMLVVLVVIGLGELTRSRPRLSRLSFASFLALVGVALPVSVQVGLEVWAFNVASVIAGWLGSAALAAHVGALNAVALAFMLAAGVSAAAATRVGNLVGANEDWRPASRAALGLGALVMTCSGAFFLTFPEAVGRAYNTDPEVVALMVTVLPLGAVFGLADGSQVVAFGILRGLGDTRVPTLFNLVGYWVVGLPLGAALALSGFGLAGVWWGLAMSLTVVVAMLLWRIRGHALRRPARDRYQ